VQKARNYFFLDILGGEGKEESAVLGRLRGARRRRNMRACLPSRGDGEKGFAEGNPTEGTGVGK